MKKGGNWSDLTRSIAPLIVERVEIVSTGTVNGNGVIVRRIPGFMISTWSRSVAACGGSYCGGVARSRGNYYSVDGESAKSGEWWWKSSER